MHHSQRDGWVEVICGSMFSGKTEELIRRVRRAQIARQKVQVFKPVLDNRYAVEKVTSHNGLHFEATPVRDAAELMSMIEPDTTVVAVDEAILRLADRRGVRQAGRPGSASNRSRFGHGFSR